MAINPRTEPVEARCGRTDEHGAHQYLVPNGRRFGAVWSDLRVFCAGNRNIVEAVTHEARTIGAGDEALLVYPAGDCDRVTILSLTPTVATVRLPDGRTYRTVPEDIGIGVDDELTARYDRFTESVYGMPLHQWRAYGELDYAPHPYMTVDE